MALPRIPGYTSKKTRGGRIARPAPIPNWRHLALPTNALAMEDACAMNDAKPLETSEQHARLAAIYVNRSADLSPELAQRRSMLAR